MKKLSLLIALVSVLLSACSVTGTSTASSWYQTAQVEGSWYYASKNCSATLCPPDAR